MVAGIHPGMVYCVDCGQENGEDSEFCVRCMHPLLKRNVIHKLAVQQARVMARSQRTDYVFLTCLSVIMVAVMILILYLFFRGVHISP